MPLIILALIAAPVQVPAADNRETAFGYSFAVPAGWSRQQLPNSSIVLSPPGPDGNAFSIMILPSQDNTLSPNAAHEQLFGATTRGSRITGGVRRFESAGWQCSESALAMAQGQVIGIGLCTTTAGGPLDGIMWTVVSEALLDAWRPAAQQIVTSARRPGQTPPPTMALGVPAPAPQAAAGSAIHGLVIPHPPSWARRDDPSGAVTLVPPQIEGVRQYFVSVLPPTPIGGTHWESHKAMVQAVRQQVPWTGEPVVVHRVIAPGPFIRSEIAGAVAGGAIYEVQLYTAAHDGTMESVVGVNGIDRNVVEPVLEATRFARPPRADLPRIVEAYRRIEQRTYIGPAGGAQVAGSLQYERIWLRADGVADFTTNYPAGYAASPEPLKVDAGLMDGDYGRWEAVGSEVHVTRSAGAAPVVYRREGGGLRGGGVLWEPMPRVDGLGLSGRYAVRSGPSDAVPYYWWVEFTPDGRFATDGLLRVSSVGDGRPRPPERGTGTYEIRDWTIFFRFSDGFVWSRDFSVLGRDLNSFTSILLQTSAYPRER